MIYVREDIPSDIHDFIDAFHAKNLVKEPTCFKNPLNPSCIDLFITNICGSFQKTTTVSTALSDFHKMIVTVLKTTYPKAQPKVIPYRDFSKYIIKDFQQDLKVKLEAEDGDRYDSFQTIFLDTLDVHAPQKKKVVRANQKPYVTKNMRKAIMLRSQLENNFFAEGTEGYWNALRKQRNYCTRLYKRERKRFYSDLNLKNITDNKKFWKTMKPLFGDKGVTKENIVLVNNEEVISEDTEVAQTFSNFFEKTVDTLGIVENKLLLNNCMENNKKGVEKAIEMFQTHPSIISIKKNVEIHSEFYFSIIAAEDIRKEIENLDPKKIGTFMDIPVKPLRQMCEVVCEPLAKIWNEEVIRNKTFPSKLKLADITPIFKSLQKTRKDIGEELPAY